MNKLFHAMIIVAIVIVTINMGAFLFSLGPYSKPKLPTGGPFTSIGSISTKNGLTAEFFLMEHERARCVVSVQQFLTEQNRAAIQMDCKQ